MPFEADPGQTGRVDADKPFSSEPAAPSIRARADRSPLGARLGVEDEIGFVLRLAQLAVFKDLSDALSPLGLRPSDFSALRVIASNPGLKQQDVGDMLGLQKPNLVPVMDVLIRQALIERRTPANDRRSYALHATAAGHALLERAEAVHREHQLRLEKALGDVNGALLRDSLRKLMGLARPRG